MVKRKKNTSISKQKSIGHQVNGLLPLSFGLFSVEVFVFQKKKKKIQFQFVTPIARMLSWNQNRRKHCYSESLSKSRRGTNSATVETTQHS